MKLQPEELAAVQSYAKEHGRKWKSQLNLDWQNARPEGVLLHLRNHPEGGPRWLANFKLPPSN